jgi:hypothetical protein
MSDLSPTKNPMMFIIFMVLVVIPLLGFLFTGR